MFRAEPPFFGKLRFCPEYFSSPHASWQLQRRLSSVYVSDMRQQVLLIVFMAILSVCVSRAATGQWNSLVTETSINYTASKATGTAATDQDGKPMTVVYLENLGFRELFFETQDRCNRPCGKMQDSGICHTAYLRVSGSIQHKALSV